MADVRSPIFQRDFTKAPQGIGGFAVQPRHMPLPFAEHAQLLDEAASAARLAGIEDGKREQANQEQLRLASALEAVGARLVALSNELKRIEATARHEAAAFAMIFARKLAGRAIEVAPAEVIAETARAIFSDLRGAPHIAVRVEPDSVDACKARLGELMRENGIETKLFVFPDPEVALGDCRIEWAEGGIVRDQSKLQTVLERSVAMLIPEPSADQ